MRKTRQFRAKSISRGTRILLDELSEDQAAQQPVHRRQRQSGAVREVGEVLVCRPFGEQLEEHDSVAHGPERTGRFLKGIAEGRHRVGSFPSRASG